VAHRHRPTRSTTCWQHLQRSDRDKMFRTRQAEKLQGMCIVGGLRACVRACARACVRASVRACGKAGGRALVQDLAKLIVGQIQGRDGCCPGCQRRRSVAPFRSSQHSGMQCGNALKALCKHGEHLEGRTREFRWTSQDGRAIGAHLVSLKRRSARQARHL
jgi:hypothetical protein